MGGRKTRKGKDSDFVTSAPCIPDAKKIPKDAKSSVAQRSIDRSEDVFEEYSVPVISVAVV